MVNDLLGFRVNRSSVFSRREESQNKEGWLCTEARRCLCFTPSCWAAITPRHGRCPGVCAAAERRGRTGLRAAAHPCGHAGERHRLRSGNRAGCGPRHGPGRDLLGYITERHGLVLLSCITGSHAWTPHLQLCISQRRKIRRVKASPDEFHQCV